MHTAEHPSAAQLEEFGLGKLPAAEMAAVEKHVAACESCCNTLRDVFDDTIVGLARAAAEQQDTIAAPPPAATMAESGPAPIAELADHPRYRILGQLGAGGMGVVYKAQHKLMERTVALKVIHRKYLDNAQALERFRKEIKAAGRLAAHPNIVAVHDSEQAGDVHFLVMEFVQGISLANLVKRQGPLPIAQACRYVAQAAQGLQHAHEHKMVHRDIKPHNLMVTRSGQVKILDFGLARFADEAEGERRLTSVDAVVGTPDFLSPEQARNSRNVDIRSDIYSLGCTLYFLLTGQPPYPEGNAIEKLLAH